MKGIGSVLLMVTVFCSALFPRAVAAAVLTADTVWQGEVKLAEDLLVPYGVTLTVKPGAVIKVSAAESTKTDPEYMSPLTEITVRGTLKVEGTVSSPVEFSGVEQKPGSWAGIIVDHGTAEMAGFRILNAEAGVHVFDGTLRVRGGVIQNNRYGLVAQGSKSDVAVDESSRISGNDYGVFTLQGARLAVAAGVVKGNRKKDAYIAGSKAFGFESRLDTIAGIPVSRHYDDAVFRGDTVWQGRIEVGGTIRVPEGSRLIIVPGTIVEFLKKDTNGDGIGENGLMIQGQLIAKGTRENPIVFRSAEKVRKMGDWDAINIMNSAGAQNLVEYCRIEDAYRGLHFHFSNVTVHHSVIANNYRAIQFQESLVDARGNYLIGNNSGVQGRDSDVTFSDNLVGNNYLGGNFFRTNLTARGNRFVGNWKEGLRVREGVSFLRENLFDGNRQGLMVSDMFYGDYSRNSVSNNLETGLSLKNADNVQITGNLFSANGINGLNVQESRAVIERNLISGNGERGIGVLSFDGVITANNFASNGLYAIDLDGDKDVSAPANWWGGVAPERVIFDKRLDPARGRVAYGKPATGPFHFIWPLQVIATETAWHGTVTVDKTVTVLPGATLTVSPGTMVEFADGTGIAVRGKLIARGSKDRQIVFTSVAKKGASDWEELQLEYATGSEIAHCRFEYATWGVHSHFTNLSITDSHFYRNYGGMRFRSGPVEVKNSIFEENSIGIRAYLGNAVISGNVITRNETGIFVREKGGGLLISRNNIYDNSNYNLRIGDFNAEDVNARDNWWGPGDPLLTIFDGRNEPGIGKVLFEPYLKAPVAAAVGAVP